MSAARHRRDLQTADRLASLRLRLVGLFTALSLTGLAGMAAVGIVVDAQQRENAMLADLRITSNAVLSLIYREAGTLRMTGIADVIGTRATGVYVFERRGTTLGPALARPGRTRAVPLSRLEPAAWASITGGSDVVTKVVAADGTTQQALSVAFQVDSAARPAGSVVVTVDAQASDAAHGKLVVALLGGSLGFSLVSGLGGLLLARRGTRAVELALSQQERFLAEAAHELRTPLTTLRINAEAAGLPSILRPTNRMITSVETLLTRARLMAGTQPLRPQDFRLDQLVAELIEETVHLPHHADADLPETVYRGDPEILRIAIRNVLENAVRHGVSADGSAELEVAVAEDGVTVRDHGRGLSGSGTAGNGLGLSIVDWAVGLHGGRLELADHPDGGTRARLVLP